MSQADRIQREGEKAFLSVYGHMAPHIERMVRAKQELEVLILNKTYCFLTNEKQNSGTQT